MDKILSNFINFSSNEEKLIKFWLISYPPWSYIVGLKSLTDVIRILVEPSCLELTQSPNAPHLTNRARSGCLRCPYSYFYLLVFRHLHPWSSKTRHPSEGRPISRSLLHPKGKDLESDPWGWALWHNVDRPRNNRTKNSKTTSSQPARRAPVHNWSQQQPITLGEQ